MNYLFIFFASFFLVVFQISFLSHFPIFGWLPLPDFISGWTLNLVLVAAFWILIFRDFKRSLIFSFFSGLFLDFLSAEPFGLGLLSLIISIFLMNLLFGLSKLSDTVRFFAFLPVVLIIYEVFNKILLWGVLKIIE